MPETRHALHHFVTAPLRDLAPVFHLIVLHGEMLYSCKGDQGSVPYGTEVQMATNILVVDDNPDLGLTLKMALELEGYTASLATTGSEALALQRQAPRYP